MQLTYIHGPKIGNLFPKKNKIKIDKKSSGTSTLYFISYFHDTRNYIVTMELQQCLREYIIIACNSPTVSLVSLQCVSYRE